ncbi:hypothetical protein BKA57DRAFT_433167 [Linnemannia elongata]|nr:hypothetical protein BKA57DRAFT_433167 [Linnemannia elongata]
MAPAIFGLRLWVAFVALVNFIIIITFHAYVIPSINKGADEGEFSQHYEYYWGDYAIAIASVVLLPAYIYSIWGKKSLVSNKYARAVLMLLPALFLIGVQIHQIDDTIKFIKMRNESRPGHQYKTEPFSCAIRDGDLYTICIFARSETFVPIVAGFFVIIEVAVTLFRGPLHSPKEAYL